MASKDGDGQCLPPPPPAAAPIRLPVARPGVGSSGRRIRLLTNHFTVRFSDKVFYQYSVSITSEDGDKRAVDGKGIGRKVMEKLYQTYKTELAGKEFAYDGEKALFTIGPLPQNKLEFTVVLEDSSARSVGGGSPGNACQEGADKKRSRNVYRARTFKVEISFSTKIPTKAIANVLRGSEAEGVQDALRVFDIILRQQQAKRGCLLVKQSFFGDHDGDLVSLGGGISGCRGFHSSFRTTQSGLSLNMDVSTTMIMTPGPVIEFLLANQNAREPRQIDWAKAKRMLKNMRIKTKHHKMEFKIIGLSEHPCTQQLFSMKKDGENIEMTVSDYFVHVKNINLTWSRMLPCLDVGRPKRPNYVPIELCDLVSLQRYTKALSGQQRASLVEKSRQKPQERIKVVTDALKTNRYEDEPLLVACGIAIERQLTQIEGRVLEAPALKFGGSEDFVPRDGRWNFNNKTLWSPIDIDRWLIVNFSARCDTSYLSRELISCGRKKGMKIERPYTIVEEDPQLRKAGPIARVDRMFELVKSKLPGPPDFILCVLPERKNSDLYGPWKKKNLHEMGIKTQCISPLKINDQYLTNVLLKINAKLGGINSILAVEKSLGIPLVNKIPTLILGMDVSHGSPGRSGVPSIAAVVGSRCWPLISQYRASVRSQSPRVEMIDSLCKPLPDGADDGIIREILIDFYQTSHQRKPEHIIIFRNRGRCWSCTP